jgi:tRNA pseudouridine38-40 synthase
MMGSLIALGRGEVDLEFIEESLRPNSTIKINFIAPASGLILHKIEF